MHHDGKTQALITKLRSIALSTYYHSYKKLSGGVDIIQSHPCDVILTLTTAENMTDREQILVLVAEHIDGIEITDNTEIEVTIIELCPDRDLFQVQIVVTLQCPRYLLELCGNN